MGYIADNFMFGCHAQLVVVTNRMTESVAFSVSSNKLRKPVRPISSDEEASSSDILSGKLRKLRKPVRELMG